MRDEFKYNREHLHASVGASTVYGMIVGAWLAGRAPQAGLIESFAFGVFLMLAPGIVMSQIDKRFSGDS